MQGEGALDLRIRRGEHLRHWHARLAEDPEQLLGGGGGSGAGDGRRGGRGRGIEDEQLEAFGLRPPAELRVDTHAHAAGVVEAARWTGHGPSEVLPVAAYLVAHVGLKVDSLRFGKHRHEAIDGDDVHDQRLRGAREARSDHCTVRAPWRCCRWPLAERVPAALPVGLQLRQDRLPPPRLVLHRGDLQPGVARRRKGDRATDRRVGALQRALQQRREAKVRVPQLVRGEVARGESLQLESHRTLGDVLQDRVAELDRPEGQQRIVARPETRGGLRGHDVEVQELDQDHCDEGTLGRQVFDGALHKLEQSPLLDSAHGEVEVQSIRAALRVRQVRKARITEGTRAVEQMARCRDGPSIRALAAVVQVLLQLLSCFPAARGQILEAVDLRGIAVDLCLQVLHVQAVHLLHVPINVALPPHDVLQCPQLYCELVLLRTDVVDAVRHGCHRVDAKRWEDERSRLIETCCRRGILPLAKKLHRKTDDLAVLLRQQV